MDLLNASIRLKADTLEVDVKGVVKGIADCRKCHYGSQEHHLGPWRCSFKGISMGSTPYYDGGVAFIEVDGERLCDYKEKESLDDL